MFNGNTAVVTVCLFLAGQTIGAIWWASKVDTTLKSQAEAQEDIHSRLVMVEREIRDNNSELAKLQPTVEGLRRDLNRNTEMIINLFRDTKGTGSPLPPGSK